jgi:hypothetical protein
VDVLLFDTYYPYPPLEDLSSMGPQVQDHFFTEIIASISYISFPRMGDIFLVVTI